MGKHRYIYETLILFSLFFKNLKEYDLGKCVCNKNYYGNVCQYMNECSEDTRDKKQFFPDDFILMI